MGSKGGGKTTTNTVAEPWKDAQPFLRNLIGDAENLYDQGGLNFQPWQGIRVAPQSNMTQAAQGMFYDQAMAGNPVTGPAQAAFGDIVGGNTIYNDLDAVKQNALGDILPAVSSRFGQAGMLDSTLAADTMARAATQAIAPIEYGAYDQAQNRRLGALGMAPQLAASSYLDPQMLSMAGSSQDQYLQSVLNSAMNFDRETQSQAFDELGRASQLGMGFGGVGGSQSSSSKEGGGSSTLGTIGGIAQAVLPFAMMAFASDRRLKTDITRIGETEEGYPKYEFRYHWDEPGMRRVGVMADEVPPEITVDVGGIKFVNYAEVTL